MSLTYMLLRYWGEIVIMYIEFILFFFLLLMSTCIHHKSKHLKYPDCNRHIVEWLSHCKNSKLSRLYNEFLNMGVKLKLFALHSGFNQHYYSLKSCNKIYPFAKRSVERYYNICFFDTRQ